MSNLQSVGPTESKQREKSQRQLTRLATPAPCGESFCSKVCCFFCPGVWCKSCQWCQPRRPNGVRLMWHHVDGDAEHDELRRVDLLEDACCDACFCFNPQTYHDVVLAQGLEIVLPPVVLVGGKIIDEKREALILPPRVLNVQVDDWVKVLRKGVPLAKEKHCSYTDTVLLALHSTLQAALHEVPASSFMQQGDLSDGKIITASVKFKSDLKAVWEHVTGRMQEAGCRLTPPPELADAELAKTLIPRVVPVSTAVATRLAAVWCTDAEHSDAGRGERTALDVLLDATTGANKISVSLTKLDAPDSELGEKHGSAALIDKQKDRPFRVQSFIRAKDVRTTTWSKLLAP